MIKTDLLIYGTTVYGCARAAARAAAGQDCLLLDPTILIGKDFCACHKAGSSLPPAGAHPLTTGIYDEMRSRGIADEAGTLHVAAAAGILAERLRDAHARVLLQTEVEAVTPEQDGFSVRIFTRDGYDTVRAKAILDTTAVGILADEDVSPFTRSLSLPLSEVRADAPLPAVCDGARTDTGLLPGEAYLRLPIPFGLSLSDARKAVLAYWERHARAEFDGYELAVIPPAFRYDAEKPFTTVRCPGWTRHPSEAYGSFFAAVEGGASL